MKKQKMEPMQSIGTAATENPVCYTRTQENANLHLTMKHRGKMEGMVSLSTSCQDNSRCIKRRAAAEFLISKLHIKNKSELKKLLKRGKINTSIYKIIICFFCFADALLKAQTNNRPVFKKNGDILRSRILKDEEVPFWPLFVGRIESFGDVETEENGGVTQARNYIKIIRFNPRTIFGVWTHNPDIWKKALDLDGKPENMVFIQSSVSIDKVDKPHNSYVDKIFTVFSNEEAATTQGYVINCGGRKCMKCLKCYSKNGIKYINELLK